ncbi:hypothetical protein K458DRAFT_388750 [Lentithecium fluviatile CBS 122367]|uniref:Uncharacterized protein n=1 Tax=Lentithecium fluviatile CBS 122367 TaxID=1168545 RepID=A0A6G1J235_9PLEO|nr:hypothetical protein K458DRAFT_388750 [Lentithecium fluviatile CBS 122367]
MGFLGQQVSRSEYYVKQDGYINLLKEEATSRAANNVLFTELECLGGAKTILGLGYEEWKQVENEVAGKVRETPKNLRKVFDDMEFLAVASEKEKRAQIDADQIAQQSPINHADLHTFPVFHTDPDWAKHDTPKEARPAFPAKGLAVDPTRYQLDYARGLKSLAESKQLKTETKTDINIKNLKNVLYTQFGKLGGCSNFFEKTTADEFEWGS